MILHRAVDPSQDYLASHGVRERVFFILNVLYCQIEYGAA